MLANRRKPTRATALAVYASICGGTLLDRAVRWGGVPRGALRAAAAAARPGPVYASGLRP